MKAFIMSRFGGSDVFEAREVSPPEPGPSEVLVRVTATSVNPVDYKIRQHGETFGIEPPALIGYDVSGTVEAVGAGVTDVAAGDDVFYTPEVNERGSYAEYHVARAALVTPKPARLSHEEAAALPLAGCTRPIKRSSGGHRCRWATGCSSTDRGASVRWPCRSPTLPARTSRSAAAP